MVRDGGEEGLGQECHHLFGCLCNRLHPTNLHPKLPAKCPAKFLGPAREMPAKMLGPAREMPVFRFGTIWETAKKMAVDWEVIFLVGGP